MEDISLDDLFDDAQPAALDPNDPPTTTTAATTDDMCSLAQYLNLGYGANEEEIDDQQGDVERQGDEDLDKERDWEREIKEAMQEALVRLCAEEEEKQKTPKQMEEERELKEAMQEALVRLCAEEEEKKKKQSEELGKEVIVEKKETEKRKIAEVDSNGN